MPHGAAADWCKLLYINFSDRSFWVCWECVVGKLLLAAPLRLFLFPSIDDQRQVRNANILLLIYCWIISIRYPVCRQKVGEGGFMFRVLLFICADKTLFYLILKCLHNFKLYIAVHAFSNESDAVPLLQIYSTLFYRMGYPQDYR